MQWNDASQRRRRRVGDDNTTTTKIALAEEAERTRAAVDTGQAGLCRFSCCRSRWRRKPRRPPARPPAYWAVQASSLARAVAHRALPLHPAPLPLAPGGRRVPGHKIDSRPQQQQHQRRRRRRRQQQTRGTAVLPLNHKLVRALHDATHPPRHAKLLFGCRLQLS